MLLLPVLQAVSELIRALRNLIPGARWRGLARLGDRETRIRVAWHMGAERGPWDSASWVKGFLLPAHCLVWGSLVPGIIWFWDLAATMPGRKRDIHGVSMSVYVTNSGVSSSAAVLMGGVSMPHKQTNK